MRKPLVMPVNSKIQTRISKQGEISKCFFKPGKTCNIPPCNLEHVFVPEGSHGGLKCFFISGILDCKGSLAEVLILPQ